MRTYICLICLFLASCSQIQEGYVVSKSYEPERVYTTLEPVTIGKVTFYQNVTHFDDEDFYIEIIKLKSHSRKIRHRTITVNKEIFNSLKVGDYYKFK